MLRESPKRFLEETAEEKEQKIKNTNANNVNFSGQANGDFDVFLSTPSESRKVEGRDEQAAKNNDEEQDKRIEKRGCWYDCLFLCKSNEDLSDELLRRTYQHRGEVKKYEEKLQRMDEEHNAFLEKAQKRYEDLVWAKEDFIYDIKEMDFKLQRINESPDEDHNENQVENENNNREKNVKTSTNLETLEAGLVSDENLAGKKSNPLKSILSQLFSTNKWDTKAVV